MATYSDRVRAYRLDMGLTQVQMSEILGVSRSTYTHYEGNVAPKTLTQCKDYAALLGVTMDWLTGYADSPKWGPEITRFRAMLQNQSKALEGAPTVMDRCRLIVDLAARREPPLNQAWFMAGILGISQQSLAAFRLSGAQVLGQPSISRLSDLTGIPGSWLLLGNADGQEFSVNLGASGFSLAIAEFTESGITEADLLDAMEYLKRYVNAKRALSR